MRYFGLVDRCEANGKSECACEGLDDRRDFGFSDHDRIRQNVRSSTLPKPMFSTEVSFSTVAP